jgi:hypothetical protein
VADKATKRQLPTAFNAPAKLSAHGLNHGIALYNRRANGGAFGDFQMITPPMTIREGELAELLSSSSARCPICRPRSNATASRASDGPAMTITICGYSDRLCAVPGETIEFKVSSCLAPRCSNPRSTCGACRGA